MDLNDIWGENKRFISGVVGGALVFLIASLVIQSLYGDELSGARLSMLRLKSQLQESRYGTAERESARGENELLQTALNELTQTVAFHPRADFRLDAKSGSAVNQYHRTVARVRESLLTKSGRANLFLDADLGLPDLSPSEGQAIERYMDALDAIELAVQMAIDSGVERVDDVRIRLDPGLFSRKGTGPIERTRVELELAGSGLALMRFLRSTRTPTADGRSLIIGSLELRPARNRADESRLALSLDLVRLHGLANPEQDSNS